MAWRKVIRLLIEDIDRIERFLEGLDQDRFINDERTVIAVCYAFVRIGQGVMQLPESIRAARPTVPWKEVRHFRNFMVHVYMAVDPLGLYETARKDLPGLRRVLQSVLDSTAAT